MVIGTVAQPAAELLRSACEGPAAARFASLFTDATNLRALWNSLWLSGLTVIIAAVIGVPLAWLLAPIGRTGRVLMGIALTPLLLSPVLGTLSFHFLFGVGGVIRRVFPNALPDFQGQWAVLIVHALTLYVYFLLFVAAAMERMDHSLIQAARTLGASRWKAFQTVTLPLLRPALSAAAILTFMSSMASFTAPYIFGGSERYLTTAIFVARKDDPALASALSVLLAVISVAASATMRWSPESAASGTKGTALELRLSPAERGLRAVAGMVVIVPLVLPVMTFVLLSFKPFGRIGSGALLSDLTLEHYRTVFASLLESRAVGPAADLLPSIGRSAAFAVVATVIDIGVALAIVLVRPHSPKAWRAALEWLAMLPLAVPGTVVAIAIIGAFARHGPFGAGPPLIGTASILVLAYFVRHLPVQLRATVAALAQLDANLPAAARTLGASPIRALVTVTLPLLGPGIVAGATMGIVTNMGEFVASILLYTPSTTPASVAIYSEFSNGSFGVAAAAGVLLSLTAAVLVAAARLWFPGRRGGPGSSINSA